MPLEKGHEKHRARLSPSVRGRDTEAWKVWGLGFVMLLSVEDSTGREWSIYLPVLILQIRKQIIIIRSIE